MEKGGQERADTCEHVNDQPMAIEVYPPWESWNLFLRLAACKRADLSKGIDDWRAAFCGIEAKAGISMNVGSSALASTWNCRLNGVRSSSVQRSSGKPRSFNSVWSFCDRSRQRSWEKQMMDVRLPV